MFAKFKRIAPRRGWRAFAGEVGVIVLGVLIAVAIGKVVEALDWRDKVATAQAALDDDIHANIFFLVSERTLVSPCLRKQLDRLEASILGDPSRAGADVKQSLGFMVSGVYVHPTRPWSALEWTSVVADNLPAHMTRQNRVFYRELYQAIEIMGALDAAEQSETAGLDLMSRPAAITPDAQTEILGIILRERQRVDLMDGFAKEAVRRLREQGLNFKLTNEDIAQMNTRRWCRENGLL